MLRLLGQALPPALRWEVPLLARGLKTTTGIVGLPADPEARQHLREKYAAVLEAIQVVPASAEYRRAVEKTVAHKLALVDSDDVDEAVEEKLGRQLEEEIKMCDNELSLIPKMAGGSGGRARAGGRVGCASSAAVPASAGGRLRGFKLPDHTCRGN